eukprot:9467683-Pyramimonas_sp.AAC.1
MMSLVSVLRCTSGEVEFWTDSDILFRGWNRGRHLRPAGWSVNGDLWEALGSELQARGESVVTVHFLNSHLSPEDSLAKGVPMLAWIGNQVADHLAAAAAASHAIPPARL